MNQDVNAFNKVQALYVDQVTRLEIIDQTTCKKCNGEGHVMERGLVECSECGGSGIPGRSVIFWDKDKQIDLSLQDDERTLKITITERGKQ